jgi:hypothetical protein
MPLPAGGLMAWLPPAGLRHPNPGRNAKLSAAIARVVDVLIAIVHLAPHRKRSHPGECRTSPFNSKSSILVTKNRRYRSSDEANAACTFGDTVGSCPCPPRLAPPCECTRAAIPYIRPHRQTGHSTRDCGSHDSDSQALFGRLPAQAQYLVRKLTPERQREPRRL